MTDINAWLAALGLERYAEVFAENDIDMEVVREVRNTWQFFRDRRPETYARLTDI